MIFQIKRIIGGNLSTWLNAWRNRGAREPTGPIMELAVLAGEDAGSQFTLEGDRVLVGRGQSETGQTNVIRLDDKSISRRQAWIDRDTTGTSIEHIKSAANATFLNGVAVSRARLSVGDRIEMGRVVIDVRARGGTNLRGLTEMMQDAALESTATGAVVPVSTNLEDGQRETPDLIPALQTDAASISNSDHGTLGVANEVTDVRPMDVRIGELVVVRGADSARETNFPIFMGRTRIGRGDDVEVQISELGVSRLHAEINMEGRSIVLTPVGATNATLINGLPLLGRAVLRDGDEIQLADRVVLRVHFATAEHIVADQLVESDSGLSRRMKHKIDLDREIEEFNIMGSFVDVDVVASRTMKGRGEKAEHIIVSFESFRAYVGGICEESGGQVLNSNGDELMCFFENAASAVLAGSAILERLEDFNRDQNLLSIDFSFRIGVHTGLSLVDLNAGIAYSEVLDTAGHIQKMAEPNTIVLSQTTLDSLPKGFPVTKISELSEELGPLFRIDRFLNQADCEE